MKITPLRTMWLDGKRVEKAKTTEVSTKEGELAIRHGWAIEAKEKTKLTVEEIKEKLTEAGIEFPADAKKDELAALLPNE
jgi:hypothetical protein